MKLHNYKEQSMKLTPRDSWVKTPATVAMTLMLWSMVELVHISVEKKLALLKVLRANPVDPE